MTPEQEVIADKVIQIHKDNNGLYDWKNFIEIFNTTHDNRLVIARTLREKGFIGDHVSGTMLKENGWEFKGFEAERLDKTLESLRQERKHKADELDFLIKSWQVKTKYLPYIVSFSALIGTIISIIISYKALKKPQVQTNLQPMQTEILELTKRVTRMDSLFRSDTLLIKRKK